MSYLEDYLIFWKNILIDVKILLVGEDDRKCLFCGHQVVLAVFQRFKELFIGTEMTSDHIEITVPLTAAAYDCITELYGKQSNIDKLGQTQHILQKIICLDFFGR